MIDPVTTVYTRLVTLLREDKDWPVADINFIHFADIQGTQDPEKAIEGDGDFPQAILEGPVGGNSSMATENAVMATYADPDDPLNPATWKDFQMPAQDHNTVNYIERATWDFRLTLTSQTERLDDFGPLLTRTLRVIRRAGASLGLKWVTGVTFRFTCGLTVDDQTQIKRWQIVLTLSIQTEIEEAALDGAA